MLQTAENIPVMGIALTVLAFMAVYLAIKIPVWFRVVVPTNEVHIVQSSKETKSFGKGLAPGNTYYAWPAWIPYFGVVTSKFTLAVFSTNLKDYEAFDTGRLPFVVDVMAFFRITDSSMAAERVSTFEELQAQLKSILQGAVRSILAKSTLEEILSERGTFGAKFTAEVEGQLLQWGCETVKNIEFMDIRDSANSAVIKNIMEKKKSQIEMESRTEVAKNKKLAEIAEIQAKQESDIKRQEAEQQVGIRTAQKEKEVGIAQELAAQEVQAQAKVTAERNMEVQKVNSVKSADIAKEVAIVQAKQAQEVKTVNAEADKKVVEVTAVAALEKTKREAEGILVTAENTAKGIELEGTAKAEAAKAMQLASVAAQTELAEKIGGNEGYQKYLVDVRTVEANQAVGIEQAHALAKADIKVFANGGSAADGLTNAGKMFSPQKGLDAASALEAFAATDMGAAFLKRFGITAEAAKELLKDTAKK